MTRILLVAGLTLATACGTEPPCPEAALPALEIAPAWAVVTSDYSSTAIAILDDEGELISEAWVDSGSAEAGIVAALSGDVSLPSQPLARNELTLIDRFGVDVVSRFDLSLGAVIAQLDTQLDPSAGGGGFRANPQDVVRDDDGSLLVSRFQPNFDPSAPELDRGNDLIRVDADGPSERISFDALDADIDGVHIYARPSRMARLGDFLLVGLGRLDAEFEREGAGAVAIVSGQPSAVSALALEGLVNCPELRASPTGAAVIVLCAGDSFSGAEGRRVGAGIARIALGPGGPAVSEIWRAADHPAAPVPTGAPVPIGGGRVAVPALGNAMTGDRIAVVDLVSQEVVVGYEAREAFVIGAGGYEPATRLLLVPDANEGVLRFRVEGLTLTALPPVDVSPCRHLPARELSALLR